MKFLVTNDDGIHSAGVAAVVEVLQHFGQVYVVCPDEQRSAASHSITLQRPLQVKKSTQLGVDIPTWTVNGTPADCVKLALDVLVPQDIDLVISGVNIGANIGHDHYYSGTVSGAVEASLWGISAIAMSLDVFDGQQADFSFSKRAVFHITEELIRLSNQKKYLLNINIPHVGEGDCKGIRVAPPDFSLKRYAHVEVNDPDGGRSYLLEDRRASLTSECPYHDFALLNEGYITITPLHGNVGEWDALEMKWLSKFNKLIMEGSQVV